MGVIRKLGVEGDVETAWEVGDDGTVKEARQVFDLAVKEKQYLAFADGEQVREFVPEAGEIILTRRLVGG